MVQSDAELIQQILQGNQDAFGPLVRKHQKGRARACMAEDRRLSHCTRDYTRRIPESLRQTWNIKKSQAIPRLALCNCCEFESGLAPKACCPGTIFGGNRYE